MPVHWQDVPSETAPSSTVRLDVVLQDGGIALAKAVDIDDRAEVIELKMHCELGRFPVRAFDRFAVTPQDIRAIAGMLETFSVQRDADAGLQACAQGAGGHDHE